MTKMPDDARADFKALSAHDQEAYIDLTAELRATRLMVQSAMGFAMAITAALGSKGVVPAGEIERLGKESMLQLAMGMFSTLKESAIEEIRREVSDDA